VNCRDAQALFERRPLPEEAADHAASCMECGARLLEAEMSSLLGAPSVAVPSLPPLARVQGALHEGPFDRLRSLGTPARALVAAVVTSIVTLLVFAATRRPDLAVYPTIRLAAELVLQAIAGVGAAWLVLRPLYRAPLSGAALVATVTAALLVPVALALLPVAHADHPASLGGTGATFAPRALACFVFGLATAAPLLAALWLFDRAPRPATLLAMAGAGGLLGSVSLLLHCPITHPTHLVAGHASVGLALAALLALGARRLVR
jgi:hypothetical protein